MPIIIPKKIKVGYQNREGTYSGKLAYVIYYDSKNVLRKEKSWEGWRNKEILPNDYENIPLSGFVLNRTAGGLGYSRWDSRKTYVRCYDPRGFEFEITIPNLLYILENCSSIKGKGLEGEFVYGWDGKDLVLLPTSSPDYKDLCETSNKVQSNDTIKSKDLIVGATYLHKNGNQYIYMGKHDEYNYSGVLKGKRFWFYEVEEPNYSQIMTTPNGKFVEVVNKDCSILYPKFYEKMISSFYFSPKDPNHVYVPYSYDDLDQEVLNANPWFDFYILDSFGKYQSVHFSCTSNIKGLLERDGWNGKRCYFNGTFEEFMALKPYYKETYLMNGQKYLDDKVQ